MRIGIDARFLTHPQLGGFKTYSECLIAALVELDRANEYLLYVDRKPAAALPTGPHVQIRSVSGSAPLVGMPWREQVSLAALAARDRLDLFHAPCLTAPLALPCPLVVTIHDMIWRSPARFSQGARPAGRRSLMERYYRSVPALAARRARAVITVSESVKSDIVAELGLPPARVTVTPEAARSIFRPMDAQAAHSAVRSRYGLEPGYVLAIGSADPRKNLDTMLRAYAALPAELRAHHRLAIVWTHRHLAEAIGRQAQALGIAGATRFLEAVSDADLVALYRSAALFAFPSRYEGFGLPPLEAMACGTPVVAAANSSIPEIVGEAALQFPTEDAAALTAALRRCLEHPALRGELAEAGLRRAASFSWQRCAALTLAVYEKTTRRHTGQSVRAR